MTDATAPAATLSDYPAFRQFWLARVGASFAFQMLTVVVGWQIYSLTGSALNLGLIGLVQFVPSVVLALPAGHVADRYSRRGIVLVCILVQCVALAVLSGLTFAGRLDEIGIFVLLFVIGVASALQFPALQSMVPGLVPSGMLAKAMAASSAANQMASVAGPALGGLLYIMGPGVVYAIGAAMTLLSAFLLARMPYEHKPLPREPATLKTVFAGVHFIRRRRDVLGVISLDLFAVLLGGATALLPIFAKDILHTGPWGLGLLRGAPAAGAVAMSLWLTRHGLQKHVGMTMFGAVAGFGAATIVFALSTSLWLSLAALLALGAFDMISMAIRGALVQLDTPDEMRGRVSAVNAIFINTSNQLGDFESGVIAAWLGAVKAALLGGIGTLVVVGLWMLLFPHLRKRQQLQSEAP